MRICIFEDDQVYNFEPLTFTRPVYALVCGFTTLAEKIQRNFPDAKISFHTRKYLKDFLQNTLPQNEVNDFKDDEYLFINGRILADENLAKQIPYNLKEDRIFVKDNFLAAAKISGKNLEKLKQNLPDQISINHFENIPEEKVDVDFAEYIWDLIYANRNFLIKDFEFFTSKEKEKIKGKVYEGAHLVEKDQIFIDEGASVKPGAVLDASDGPIYISKNAKILANAVLENCIYIGESSLVRSGATIHDNVTISKICKAGGEIEDAIFLPYSNKQHAGFIGHAYLGSWVNLGADTNCSDLKNNYGSIKIYLNGKEINSGKQFLGVLIGDHSKTGINTMLNTATVIGVSSNIFGAGFPDKYIPSFAWGGAEGFETFKPEKAVEVAGKVMLRRNIEMKNFDEKIFNKVFEMTKDERIKKGF